PRPPRTDPRAATETAPRRTPGRRAPLGRLRRPADDGLALERECVRAAHHLVAALGELLDGAERPECRRRVGAARLRSVHAGLPISIRKLAKVSSNLCTISTPERRGLGATGSGSR